ncbi:MAG: hypothetical protein IH892_00275, partial [Planctomycetes bacterium]|nr:hypothetical protein [Planctomycetota bacterium]
MRRTLRHGQTSRRLCLKTRSGSLSGRRRGFQTEPRSERGVVLLITIVLLVVMSLLGYTVTTRVAAQRHRTAYLIQHAPSRYACD